MILYVLVTAVLYISVGYYLGRRLMYAPLNYCPTGAGLGPAAAEPLDRIFDESNKDSLPIDVATAATDERKSAAEVFIPGEHLPQAWLERYPDAIESESAVEASVQVLHFEVHKYRDRLLEVDGRVRQCVRSPDPDKLQAAVDELRTVNAEWINRQAEAARFLLNRSDHTGDAAHVRDHLEQVLQSQAMRIEAAWGDIESFDFKASPLIGARRLVIEVRKLTDLAHTLRDCMQDLLFTVLASQGRLKDMARDRQIDPLTGLRNRAGIENYLRDWWRADGRRVRQVSVAMLDIDRFASTLERWGARVTDELIATIARQIDEMLRTSSGLDWCGRFAGQRFFLFWADTGPHAATSVLERIRLTIGQTRFELVGGALSVSLSGAVTEVLPDDSCRSLFKRLNSTLREAKQSGRNCTFLVNGDELARVRPPDFQVERLVARLQP